MLLFLTNCHPLFCTWDWEYDQLKVEPPHQSLIGQYVLNESSNEFLTNKGFEVRQCKLELFENGRFKFTNAPDIIFDGFKIPHNILQDKEGKWSVGCHASYDCLIEFEKVFVVPLAEKNEQLAILITVGDGDECNGVVFERIE